MESGTQGKKVNPDMCQYMADTQAQNMTGTQAMV